MASQMDTIHMVSHNLHNQTNHKSSIYNLRNDRCRNWDIDISKLHSKFLPIDIQEIIKIPLANLHRPDIPVWIHNPKRIFTVCSAYQAFSEHKIANSQTSEQGATTKFYNKLWSLNLPGKLKHFLWRAVHNNLPTSDNLLRRKLQVDPTCKLCSKEAESAMHVFNECLYTREVCRNLTIAEEIIKPLDFRDLLESR
ncbi:hypothetical protein LIER_42206 [Lithospermum erythrorhizon]|uniref:Reverse transcriptase zinc-binding domain-containing protein n=1 Tax=Lithospermum erythrorhizon TaxID=34254 RepID=A0AAV3RRU3_LITER